jgi:hypothetical protein
LGLGLRAAKRVKWPGGSLPRRRNGRELGLVRFGGISHPNVPPLRCPLLHFMEERDWSLDILEEPIGVNRLGVGLSRRDCITQPRVASSELPWVEVGLGHQP